MSLTAVNLPRVSFTLRTFNLQEGLRGSSLRLFRVQNQLASGLRFQRPSEDVLRAAATVRFDQRLDQLDQVGRNLERVNGVLTEVESALQSAVDLFRQAHTLALQAVDDGTTADERRALLPVVNSVLDQLIAIGNRRYLNNYLFAGQQVRPPFEHTDDGVLYTGDAGRLETIIDTDLSTGTYTIPGTEFFAGTSAQVVGVVDLDPGVERGTRLSDLRGPAGAGVELGRVQIEIDADVYVVDLTGAATVGDVIDRLNAALPPRVRVDLGARGLALTQGPPPAEVRISDLSGGRTARDLGLAGRFNGVLFTGGDLDPRLTPLTPLRALRGGAGLDPAGSFVIRNGSRSATIDLRGATTVEDLLNRVNRPELGVWGRIAADGRRLEIVSRVSGAELRIEENGGALATQLGLRSLHAGTPLAELNGGRGVRTVDGADLRITTADGSTLDVDLDGAGTVQDVIDRLNAAGGGRITAELARVGNGLRIVDRTAGGGTLRVTALNASPALGDLGLDVAAAGGELVGRDVNPQTVDSPFTALLELRRGLATDARLELSRAAERVERVLRNMQRVQGEVASQARLLAERTDRVAAEAHAIEVLRSEARDLDLAEAATRFQQLQTALQANLAVAARTLNLSLLDYLR